MRKPMMLRSKDPDTTVDITDVTNVTAAMDVTVTTDTARKMRKTLRKPHQDSRKKTSTESTPHASGTTSKTRSTADTQWLWPTKTERKSTTTHHPKWKWSHSTHFNS